MKDRHTLIGKIIGLHVFLPVVYRYRERQDIVYYAIQLFLGSKVAREENQLDNRKLGEFQAGPAL